MIGCPHASADHPGVIRCAAGRLVGQYEVTAKAGEKSAKGRLDLRSGPGSGKAATRLVTLPPEPAVDANNASSRGTRRQATASGQPRQPVVTRGTDHCLLLFSEFPKFHCRLPVQ